MHHNMLRNLLCIRLFNHVKIPEILKINNLEDIGEIIKKMKLLCGLCVRIGNDEWQKTMSEWIPYNQKRKRETWGGGSAKRWRDEIIRLLDQKNG